MNTETLAKLNLALAIMCLSGSVITEMTAKGIGIGFAFLFTLLGGITVGSAIAFAGIVFNKTHKTVFGIVLLIQLAIYFLMLVIGAVNTSVANDGVTKLSLAGIAEIAALVIIAVQCIFVLKSFLLKKQVNIVIFCAVGALYLFLTANAVLSHEGKNTAELIICIAQYIQIVFVSFYYTAVIGENRKAGK